MYLVCYDISNDDRRRNVYRTLRGHGDHLQYSVFRCELSEREHAELIAEVDPLIDHDTDQILIVDLGPSRQEGCQALLRFGDGFLASLACRAPGDRYVGSRTRFSPPA